MLSVNSSQWTQLSEKVETSNSDNLIKKEKKNAHHTIAVDEILWFPLSFRLFRHSGLSLPVEHNNGSRVYISMLEYHTALMRWYLVQYGGIAVYVCKCVNHFVARLNI